MFPRDTYITRRRRLREHIREGIVLFVGNDESPINYADNTYPFRQDSTFLYYFGLDVPHLAAVIDIDEGHECIFGNELTIDDIVWTGPRPTLSQICQQVGIREVKPFDRLQPTIREAIGKRRNVHFLPTYRDKSLLLTARLMGIDPSTVHDLASVDLIKAVVAQRSVKDEDEIAQTEVALEVTYEMQLLAMRMAKPGRYEREIAGEIEGLALSRGVRLAFPTVFSIHGETLHNPSYDNLLRASDIAINDCGAESLLHYAADITRTIPVGGRFSQKQTEIYNVVLQAQQAAIEMMRPGVEFGDVHRCASIALMAGLKELRLVKGDPEEAVNAGAHTLFFPCGVGHMLGLDVHDMESLGEDYIGYTDTIRRNPQFGWRWLRLAKALEPGYVVTVEPGIYLIPALIDRWKAEHKCQEFINYDLIERYRDFGGIRIEDDVLVTDSAYRILGKSVPKTTADVENACMTY